MVNGKPTLKPEIQAMFNTSDGEAIKKIGIQAFNFVGHEWGAFDPKINGILDFRYSPTGIAGMLDANMKDYTAHYGVTKPLDVFTKASHIKYTRNISNLTSFVSTDVPQQIKDIGTNVYNYALQNWPKLVLAATDQEFDQARDRFIADMKKLKIDGMSDWYEPQLRGSVAQYNVLMKK